MSNTPPAAPQPVPGAEPQAPKPKPFVPPRRFEAMTQAEREAFIRPTHIAPPMQAAASPFRRE